MRPARVHTQPERRVHPRVASEVETVLYAFGMPAEIVGRTCDIGAGGMCVETESALGVGEAHRACLELDGETLSLKVACRWQREGTGRARVVSGLQFLEVPSSVQLAIWRHVYRAAEDLAYFIMQTSSVLSDIAFDEAIELFLFTRLASFSTGDWIYRQGAIGTRGDSAYVVLSGGVAVDSLNARTAKVFTEQLGPGDVLGGAPMVAGLPHPETAVASGETRLIEIDPYAYAHLLTTRPEATRVVTRAIVRRYLARLADLVAGAQPAAPTLVHRFRPGAASGSPGVEQPER